MVLSCPQPLLCHNKDNNNLINGLLTIRALPEGIEKDVRNLLSLTAVDRAPELLSERMNEGEH